MRTGQQQEQRYKVGDTVQDGENLGIVTDIRDDQYILRPECGPTTHEWPVEEPDQLVLIRRGSARGLQR